MATPTYHTASMGPTVTTVRGARATTATMATPANAMGSGASAAQPMPSDTPALDEPVTYQYNALGRRDPFEPLVGGGFVGADEQLAPPDVGGLKVVGIVWGVADKFALCEDPRGNSMVLRTGDKVMNGTVEGLRRDAMIVKLTTDGTSESVVIPLTRKGEDSNANR